METQTKTQSSLFCGQSATALVSALGCTHAQEPSSKSIDEEVEFPFSLDLPKRKFCSGESFLSEGLFSSRPSRKRPRVSAQKCVRFADKTVNLVIPRSVLKEDLPSAWYNRADYRTFRDDSQSLKLAFELGILDRIHPNDFCLRGLEARLSSNHLGARLAARGTMIDVVLSIQEAQKGHGMRDPEMIRGLSLVLSKDALEDALKLAAYDREEAQAVMEEE